MKAENRHLLGLFGASQEHLARLGGIAFGAHDADVKEFGDLILLENAVKALLLHGHNLVVPPGWDLIGCNLARSQRDRVARVRLDEKPARVAVHVLNLTVLFLPRLDDALEIGLPERFG